MTPAPAPSLSIHEAWRATDGSGAVYYGAIISREEAIARRRDGEDVVVRGDDPFANPREARTIESSVGPCVHGGPHLLTAGPQALPHFEQKAKQTLAGHTFYETPVRRAIPRP